MPDNDRILRGAPVGKVPNCSLAEYLLPRIRALPKDHLIQVEAESGALQTVEELLRMSTGLSEGLNKLGVQVNDVVGLLCRNSFEASAVVLGAWLSGTPVCPVAESLKPVEMKHILKVVQPKIIFCEEEALDVVTSTVGMLSTPPIVVVINGSKSNGRSHKTFQDVLVAVDPYSYAPRPIASPADQLVAILFSSGTSGLPKGVGITHTNLIFQDFNLEPVFDATDMTNCLQISQFFWVTGVLMYLKCLSKGINRVLMRNSNPVNLLKAIERYKTDWTLLAPLLALTLVENPEFDSYDTSSLKKILVGGSPLTQAMIDKIREKWPNVKIYAVYGATETTGNITANEEEKNLPSVGKTTLGVQVKIVDRDNGQPVQANALGEICVKSPGIMKGYVENEAATKEAIDEEDWFHTGDLGYYDEEGNIFIVDRIKEMIKIMNMQVAPVEVENAILEVPGVAAAAVAGVTPDGNHCEIAALVQRKQNSTVTEEEICAHIANTLSHYKRLTGGVYFVESLPKTGSGKLQRREVYRVAQMLYSSSIRRTGGGSGAPETKNRTPLN